MIKASKILFLFTALIVFGCKKKEVKPVAPSISHKESRVITTNDGVSYARVTFKFYDGDGDLGYKQEENQGEYKYNIYVDYYEKVNGNWELKSPVITYNFVDNKYDTMELHSRMPYIPNPTNNSLEGEMSVNLFYNNFIGGSGDLFRYEIYITDRAFHESNTIRSSNLAKP